MKLNSKYIVFLLFLTGLSFSCDEDEFLEEEPLDFFGVSNSFVSSSDFESALVANYALYRQIHAEDDASTGWAFAHLYGTDIFKNAREDDRDSRFGNYSTVLTEVGDMPKWHWDRWYRLVANSNTIIGRLADSELDEDERILVEAEARLFRALAYRYITYLWGDAPLLLEEVTSPQVDFVRDPQQDILGAIESDAQFAANNLPTIDQVVDGRLSNLVAYHLLAETQISLGKYTDAIAAATQVINDGNTGLMTDRFGSRSTEPGDVYWDLFRRGNQNRSSGNMEAIWVGQMETDVQGGFLVTSGTYHNALERIHVPVSWTLNDPNNVRAMLGPRSDVNVGGRGVSFLQPTDHFENTIWASDFANDIRNSAFNYSRDILYDDPNSDFFGMSAVDPASFSPTIAAQDWRWYPYLTKATTPGNHPENVISDPNLGLLITAAGSTFRDKYYIRLAETYLLRAEAHLLNGDGANAAADINVVRVRANATLVGAGDVDIDYILDERARELSLEEQRRVTLHRTGKLVERVRLYNDHNGPQVMDFHELWPIPLNDIQANTNADLTQNDGY